MSKLSVMLSTVLFSFVLTFAGVSQAEESAKGSSPAAECPYAKKGATGDCKKCPHAKAGDPACDKADCPCKAKDTSEGAMDCPCKGKKKG